MTEQTEQIRRLSVDRIRPNPDQPRKSFDDSYIAELAASIKAQGQQTPILVRPVGDHFQIVAGECRWRAHKLLGKRKISAIVRRMSVLDRDVAAIVENLQRKDVSPLEEADAFGRLAKRLTVEQIAERTGLPVFRVRWRLQLLNLCDEVRPLVASGQMDRQHALELSRLPAHEQTRVARLISTGRIGPGWKAVRLAVDTILGETAQADIFGPAAPRPSAQEVQTVSRMERRIEQVARMVADGWKDGECIIAARVSPDRAQLMADELAVIRRSLGIMERELRQTLGQAALVVENGQ
jgi:ParB/RepB/Spo0J family partition protein